ncbi:MAG: hypothetical protein ACKOA3_07455 [Sphingomonadales bacterium]
MKQGLLILTNALLCFSPALLRAQPSNRWLQKLEVGVNSGPQFFLGDLGGSTGAGTKFIKDVDWEETRPSVGAYLNLHPLDWFSIRAAFQLGMVSGNDIHSPAITPNDIFRYNRNLQFRSGTQEFYLALALYPLQLIPAKAGSLLTKIQPYALTGAGLFHFNPKAKDMDGRWVALQPLRLEGQGFNEYPQSKPYRLTQFNLNSGLGLKYYINSTLFIGVEILYRKLFTDQVDNVSASFYVDPATFDNYLSAADAARAKRLYYRGKYDLGGLAPYQTTLSRGNPAQQDAFFSQTIHIGKRLFEQVDKLLKCPVSY